MIKQLAFVGALTGAFLMTYKFCKKKGYTSGVSYCIVHVAANTMVLAQILPDMKLYLTDPTNVGILTWCSEYPHLVTVATHLCHFIVGMSGIRFSELFHHIGAISFVIIMYLTQYKTVLLNNALFFQFGLPGLIIYMLTIFRSLNIISKEAEKSICKNVNFWFRLPGLMSIVTIGLINVSKMTNMSHIIFSSTMLAYAFWNGIYWTIDSVNSENKLLFEKQKMN